MLGLNPWALAISYGIVLVTGCGVARAEENHTSSLAGALVAIATDASALDDKAPVALKQLQLMAEAQEADATDIRPLIPYDLPGEGQARGEGLFAHLDCPRARVLAAGGPEIEKATLAEVKSRLKQPPKRCSVLLLALALAEHPTAEVTTEMAALAGPDGAVPRQWRLLALALAARGDESSDWMAQVVQGLAVPTDPTQAGDHQAFMVALPYVAPKLPRSAPLADGVRRLVSGDAHGVFVPAVAAFAILGSADGRRQTLDALHALLPKDGVRRPMFEAAAHLGIARLRDDQSTEVRAALRLIGSGLHEVTDAADLQLIADTLVDDALTSEIGRALGSDEADVVKGAVYVAQYMGPAAKLMLPALQRLPGDQAALAARSVGGLNADGSWRLSPKEPAYDFRKLKHVAVVSVECTGLSEEARSEISDYVFLEFFSRGYDAVELAKAEAALQRSELQSADLPTTEGAAHAGRMLNVDAAVVVKVTAGDRGGIEVTVRLVDVQRGAVAWTGHWAAGPSASSVKAEGQRRMSPAQEAGQMQRAVGSACSSLPQIGEPGER